MRQTVRSVIKLQLSERVSKTRKVRKWTKREMSEKLDMDERSYSDIEKGVSACGTTTFVIYLLFVLDDDERSQLLCELRKQILKIWEEVA